MVFLVRYSFLNCKCSTSSRPFHAFPLQQKSVAPLGKVSEYSPLGINLRLGATKNNGYVATALTLISPEGIARCCRPFDNRANRPTAASS